MKSTNAIAPFQTETRPEIGEKTDTLNLILIQSTLNSITRLKRWEKRWEILIKLTRGGIDQWWGALQMLKKKKRSRRWNYANQFREFLVMRIVSRPMENWRVVQSLDREEKEAGCPPPCGPRDRPSLLNPYAYSSSPRLHIHRPLLISWKPSGIDFRGILWDALGCSRILGDE